MAKQTSATFFSTGDVQSKPRQDTGVQGLLASSSSSTDIAISGAGFFVVNEAAAPTINNEFLFTRAGSFFQDNEGFLRNTAGFYLQAWPTDAAGVVIPANKSLTVPNNNVISTDFLRTLNLNRVGGTASATSTIAIGANLPSNDTAGKTRKTDVQFFDTLGNATTMSLINTKAIRDNNWEISIPPPLGTSVITLEDSVGLNYGSQGQLEFTARTGRVRPDRSDFGKLYEPSHPAADGYVLTPNVNTLIEMTDMREAQRSYEANLSVIKTSKQMLSQTIDLLR